MYSVPTPWLNRHPVPDSAIQIFQLIIIIIEVYDFDSFALRRYINLPVQPSWSDLAASEAYSRVYVAVMSANAIFSIDVANNDAIALWPVCSGPATLYVTSCENILVACMNANKIQIFTSDGACVREVTLQSGITPPRGIAQLSATQLAITYANYNTSVWSSWVLHHWSRWQRGTLYRRRCGLRHWTVQRAVCHVARL